MSKSVSLLLAQLFLGWAALLGVWGCSGDVGTTGELATDLSHSMLVFSETQGRGPSRTFLLYNKGSGPLELSSLSLEGVDASRFTWSSGVSFPVELMPGKAQGILVSVTYQGESNSKANAQLVCSTDLAQKPELVLELRSLERKPSPRLQCGELRNPSQLDLGLHKLLTPMSKTCRILNDGSAAFVLQRILYMPDWGPPQALEVKAPPMPLTFAANDSHGKLIQLLFHPKHSTYPTAKGVLHFRFATPGGEPLPSMKVSIQAKRPTQPGEEPHCFTVSKRLLDLGELHYGCREEESKLSFSIQARETDDPRCRDAEIESVEALSHGTDKLSIASMTKLPIAWKFGGQWKVTLLSKPSGLGHVHGRVTIKTNLAQHPVIELKVTGSVVPKGEVTEVFKQLKRPWADFLFVIENSPAMAAHQNSLAKNFQSFINWSVRLNVDYRIAVTTADLLSDPARAGCFVGTQKIVTPTTPNPISAFQNNAKVGLSGSSKVQSLEAAYRALKLALSEGATCNQGFYRKDASLTIYFIASTADSSPFSVQRYMSFFKQLKGFRNLDLMRANVVVGPPPNGCRGAGGGATYVESNPRLWQVGKELKGVQESLCSQNWAATLSNIGSMVFWYRTQYFLSHAPNPDTIVVKVNGRRVKADPQDGWQYDPTNESINFSKAQIPPPGATISISYQLACANPSKE